MQQDCLTDLLGIQGYRVIAVERINGYILSTVRVHLERTRTDYICGECGRNVSGGFNHTMQEVKHLTFWHHQTILRYPRFRVECPNCGVRTEALNFVSIRGPRVTRFLATFISELCKITTVKAVATLYGMQRRAVKDIDKQAVAKVQAERPLDGITVMGADEVGMGTGRNKLWSLFSALEGPRGPEMLYIVEGRSEKKLKEFWRWFGKERAALITHAVLDMCRTFANSFRKHCPGVRLIFDKFHVVRHLNNALNEVRKAELGRALGRFKKTLSGKKFILMARRSRVRGKAREALDVILGASPRLYKAHLLKESFVHLWDYTYKGCAIKFWENWKAQLKWSRLKSYRSFAKMVDRHWDGILAFCDKKVSLGYIESANLKARNVIRRAYGYHDKEYMKLKIIQACTPWMARFHPWTATYSLCP